MKWGLALAIAFGITLIGFSFNHDVFAFGGTVSDGPSCTAIGASWDGVSTCTVGSIFVVPTVNTGETLTVSSGITLNIGTNGLTNKGTINNHGTITVNTYMRDDGGTLNNYNTIVVSAGSIGFDNFPGGVLNNYGTFENNKVFRNNPGTINNFAGATFITNNVLAMNLGGTFNNSGTLINTGRITTQVGVIHNPGTINNHNLIDIIVTAGNSPLDNSGTANNICSGVILGPITGNPVNSLSCQPGSLQFSSAAYSVSEDGNSAKITISRLNGIDGVLTVNYATSNGAATAGSDYTATSGTLSLGNFVTSQTFLIPILADALTEGPETVNLSLSNPTGGATLGTPSTAVLTIVDVIVNQCQPGYYSTTGNEPCTLAPAGSYAPGTGNTSATQCPAGQYQPQAGQTQCLLAPAGSFVGTTGATSATQCPAGTFSDSVGANQCTDAAPGTFATGPGATHTEFCQIGSYQPNSGQSSCLLADTGYFVSTTAATSEQQCPAGTYSDSIGQAACTQAPAGTYVTGLGATQATQCSPGSYQPQAGQTSCLQSDPGFFVAISGAISEEPCQLGFTSQAGASQCTPLPPTASDDIGNTSEDTSVTTDVLGNDSNLFDTPVSVTIENAPTNGIATVNGDNTITYTPNLNYNGQDSYQYRVTDASGDFAVATVKITVSPVNDAPTISAIAPITAPELAPITFGASATDVDSPTLTYSLVDGPAGASMTPSGAFTWTPTESQGPGTYNFQVKVTDSFFDVFADVSITVTEVNQAPTANAGNDQTVDENSPVSLSGAASDADIPVQTLTYSWSQTSGVPVVLSDDTIVSPTFTAPPVGLSGDALTFSLVVSDGQTSTSDTVNVIVNNVDTVPPEAYNQFDPVTKNVLVYGTDDSDGNLGPITPSSITKTKWHTKYDDEGGHGYDEDSDDEHDGEHDQNRGYNSKTNAELRTYTITDHSGNTMKLTEIIKQKGKEIKVKVLSIQYGNDPAISPKFATKHFEWSLDKNGTTKELEQKMTIGKGKTKQETSAKYDSKKNETKIESQNPKSKQTLPGMVLLKMGTNQGNLVISH